MEFEPMLTPREKSPLPKMSPEEDRTRDAVDSEPKHYQLSYSGPRTHVNPKRKILSTGISEEDRTHTAAPHGTVSQTRYRLNYSGLYQ